MLDAIIDLCATRILKRLESSRVRPHNPTRTRAYFGSVLATVRDAVRTWSRLRNIETQDRSIVEPFLRASEELRVLLQQLEECPERDVNRKLEDVVYAARQLNKHHQLAVLLRNITGQYLNPTTRDGFMARLGELSRYLESSRHLYQTAKNTNLFRAARVIDISLHEQHFTRAPCPETFSSFDDCLARCVYGSRDTAKLCSNRGITLREATDKLATTARKGVTESKIHAEIQIAAYYEIHPSTLPPRLICSNKNACYLCNEFIRLQGKFYIPRSHGKLYPGWRVPPLRTFDVTLSNLIERLDSKISLFYQENVHTRKRQPPAPDWTERAIVRYSESMSTLPSLPSRPTSPTVVPTLSEGHAAEDVTSPLPLHGFQPSMPTIIERPARSPTPEDVSDSESSTSTLRASPRSRTGQPLDDHSEPMPVQSGPASDGASDQVTSTSRDKGKAIATDVAEEEEEAASPPQNGTEGEEWHPSITVPDNDLGEAEPYEDGASPPESERSSSSSSSPTARPRHESTANTSPEEPDLDEIEVVDKGKGKLEAEDLPIEEADPSAANEVPPDGSHIILTKGTMVKCRLDTSRYPPSYTAGLLKIFPEFVRSLGSGRTSSSCELHVEWLTDQDTDAIAQAETQKTTDVHTIEEGVDLDSGSRHCVILGYGRITVKMSVIRS